MVVKLNHTRQEMYLANAANGRCFPFSRYVATHFTTALVMVTATELSCGHRLSGTASRMKATGGWCTGQERIRSAASVLAFSFTGGRLRASDPEHCDRLQIHPVVRQWLLSAGVVSTY
jgi:hypothetical protein